MTTSINLNLQHNIGAILNIAGRLNKLQQTRQIHRHKRLKQR